MARCEQDGRAPFIFFFFWPLEIQLRITVRDVVLDMLQTEMNRWPYIEGDKVLYTCVYIS